MFFKERITIMEKKITKKMMFEEIIAMAEAEGREDIIEFAEKEIAALDKKAAKAKETAAKKRAESDELMEVVKSLLTDEFQTLGDIAAQIEGEDITVAKVTARMTKLVKSGCAIKEEISVEGADGKKHKKMAYKVNADCECGNC